MQYLGLWEELYNPDFKPLGFEGFRKEFEVNHFSRCVFSQKLMGESF
jgi:hypothetical protein